jgi:uncharacterized linocin/CFP29 family protein
MHLYDYISIISKFMYVSQALGSVRTNEESRFIICLESVRRLRSRELYTGPSIDAVLVVGDDAQYVF